MSASLLISDIEVSTKLMLDAVNDLDDDLMNGAEIDTERGLACWAALEEVNRILAIVRGGLVDRLAQQMPDKRVTLQGIGTFERHRKTDRKRWDTEDLLRAVLDTRRLASSGEPLEETQMQKILHVWNLGAPRVGALRERGLDPDEWCETSPGGWAIQLIS